VTVREVPGGVRARWRWFQVAALPRVLAVAGWNGFLAAWFGRVAEWQSGPGWSGWLPLPHALAGMVLGWHAVRWMVNGTELQLDRGRLRFVSGPWPRRRTLELDAGDLVACGLVHAPRWSECQAWELRGVLRSGVSCTLCRVPDEALGGRVVRVLTRRLGVGTLPAEAAPPQGRT
jgi:hypothetical protein